MSVQINRAAVVGAGTMGAAIAAHLANAGLPVLLLDIVPTQLTPEEEANGLTLNDAPVRHRIVQAGFDRAKSARPPAFMSPQAEQLVSLGTTEDDLNQLAEVDLVIEAIVEQLEPKQALFERIDAVRKPGSIVASNTSGLPIAKLAAGRSDEFQRHFLGVHFFNPPRYMKLAEIIPTTNTDLTVTETMSRFVADRLGKGAVLCKDTPNFIGNRLYTFSFSFALQYTLQNGYSVEEVDALTGPLLGRPKTATFRLLDLVGIDVAAHIAHNLYDLIPDDPHRELLRDSRLENLLSEMVNRGWLGNKRGQGFYKKDVDAAGNRVFKVLNLTTFEYELPHNPQLEAVATVRKIDDIGRRLSALFQRQADRAVEFVWALLAFELAYAAAVAPEIAHDLKSIDDDMRWGFNYRLGPFELWDRLGVAETVARMEQSGRAVAPWVKEMLAAGIDNFYRTQNGRVTGVYNWDTGQYADLPTPPNQLTIAQLHAENNVIAQNDGATLFDAGDGVLLLEFHTKMNSLDEDIINMMAHARQVLAQNDNFVGLVIGNEGDNFSVGANLVMLGQAAQQGNLNHIRALVESLQSTLLAFRRSPKPVVVAVHNRALGGGVEVVFGGARVVAHAESYIGLVEPGVGLVPAAGGLTEFVRRQLSPAMQTPHTDPLPLAQQILETIGTAKVGGSAAESRALGFLGPQDRIVMNRDQLLYAAKQEVLALVAQGYSPLPPAQLFAGGRDLYAALKAGVWQMQQSGHISEHDAMIGRKLAYIIAGGDLSAAQWLPEEHFLALEIDAFLQLAATEKTQARIAYMLEKGKPLRN